MLKLEKINYSGWPNCLKLSNAYVELVATTDIGPRLLHFGWNGSRESLFYLDPATAGQTGGDEWHAYGGHRFWHGPEIMPRTYVPDNAPIQHEWDGQVLRLIPATEQLTGMQKIVEVELHETDPMVTVRHILVNHGPWEVSAAPWALTVLAPGGTAILPQEPFVPFPEALLPARPLVLWQYTDMADPRLTWESRFAALRQDADAKAPVKIGIRNSVGWGAFAKGDTVFIKKTVLDPAATYPDFGCNWETYTDSHFLELETLGPLAPIAAQGGKVEHREEWSLAKINDANDIKGTYQQVENFVKSRR